MLALVISCSFTSVIANEIDELISSELSISQNELLEAIQAKDAAIQDRDKALRDRDKALRDRDKAIDRAELAETLADGLRGEDKTTAAIIAADDFSKKDKTLEEMRKELAKVLEASRKDRIKLSYNLACVYKASRQYEKAEEQFLKALALSPDDPGIHYNLGILYDDSLTNDLKAKYHYQRFLDLAPNDPDAGRVVEWLTEM